MPNIVPRTATSMCCVAYNGEGHSGTAIERSREKMPPPAGAGDEAHIEGAQTHNTMLCHLRRSAPAALFCR